MVFLSSDRMNAGLLARFARRELAPNRYDVIAMVLIGAAAVLVVHGAQQMNLPVGHLQSEPVVLDPRRLPEYALRSTLRMFAAIFASLLFTFVVATLAAKSRKAELVIVPMLDILQSIPVFGFLTFTVTFFIGLFPTSELGVELAAIFTVFTAQAWNMAFSFYQSLRTLPNDLVEVSQQFRLSPWQRFVKLELPFATPALVWNTMMSMSGGWFFVVLSEAITVGKTTVTLPGIGSWLALAIERQDFRSVAWAVGAMAVVILLYDQFLFRPIVAWADRFRFEQIASQEQPESLVLRPVAPYAAVPPHRTALPGALADHAAACPAAGAAATDRRRAGGGMDRSAVAGGGGRRGGLGGLDDRRLRRLLAECARDRAGVWPRPDHPVAGAGADRRSPAWSGCRSGSGSACGRHGRSASSRSRSSWPRFRPRCCFPAR